MQAYIQLNYSRSIPIAFTAHGNRHQLIAAQHFIFYILLCTYIPDVMPVGWDAELRASWVIVHADVVQRIGTTQPAAQHTHAHARTRVDVIECGFSTSKSRRYIRAFFFVCFGTTAPKFPLQRDAFAWVCGLNSGNRAFKQSGLYCALFAYINIYILYYPRARHDIEQRLSLRAKHNK